MSVDERVVDLLGRMTLEEKIGQLMLWDGRSDDLSFIATYQPGSILHIHGSKVARAMDLAAQNRLAIPLLVGEMPSMVTPSGKAPPSSPLNWRLLLVGTPRCSSRSGARRLKK